MRRLGRQRERELSLTALLGLQLVAIFLSAPIAALGVEIGGVLALLLLLFMMVVAVMLTAPSSGAARLALASFAVQVIAVVWRFVDPSPLTYWLSFVSAAAAIGAQSWVVSLTVYAPGAISAHRVRGAIVLYFNIALSFTILYRLIEELAPGSFAGIRPGELPHEIAEDLLYFSMITLSTAGFGDIIPVNRIARSAASLEAVIGQLYIATVLGRLITLHTSSREKGSRRDGEHGDQDGP